MDNDPYIVCTIHGGPDDIDQEADHRDDDLEGRAADGPHPLTPAGLPAGDEWQHR
ncbi:hypothetical protein [Streptomyces sp. NPDC047000]|uniref:hypothetical protein n=1 Tax=Streptomyces sp. NPDC047000 TaxID=3155474 RepID=UPI0033F481EE